MALLSYDEALRAVLETAIPVESESIPIESALNRFVSAQLYSLVDLPRFDNSQMDGFAVRFSDLETASNSSQCTLSVMGAVPAGENSSRAISKGETHKIFTGAPMPVGADTVVPIEDVTLASDGTSIVINQVPENGDFVRLRGEDIRIGDRVAGEGDRVSPGLIALLASTGHATIPVFRKSRVVIVSNGDELVNTSVAPADLNGSQIYESNSIMLASLVTDAGGDVVEIVRSRDSSAELRNTLQKIIDTDKPDLVISTGGVSMGDRDFIRPILAELGTIKFWRAAIRPGKPILYGQLGQSHFLGLPGNPASTMVTFELFGRPLLARLSGSKVTTSFLPTRAEVEITHQPGRRSFVRAHTRVTAAGLVSVPAGFQGSHYVTTLARANSLVVIPEDVLGVSAGESCDCLVIGSLNCD